MRPKTHCSIFGPLLQAIVAATRLNGGLSDRAGNPIVPSHWRMLKGSRPSWMGCFWRWPENDSSGSFFDVPICESNDSKSRLQLQGGIPATLWPSSQDHESALFQLVLSKPAAKRAARRQRSQVPLLPSACRENLCFNPAALSDSTTTNEYY